MMQKRLILSKHVATVEIQNPPDEQQKTLFN